MKSVNRKELSEIMGVSKPTIDKWVERGCPFEIKGGRGKEWIFNITGVIKWRERDVVNRVCGYRCRH